MPLQVRRGRRDDADFLAWVMLMASRAHLKQGVWDLIIGADEAGCLEYLRRLALAEPRSLCHVESFWIGEWQGRPAAAVSGFDVQAGGWALVAEAMAQVQRELNWTADDRAASQKRAAPAWSCFLPDAGADWGIENVATRPEFRGQGFGSAMLDAVLRDGLARGRQLAQITTYIGNDRACSVYQKFGFIIADEKRCTDFASALAAPGVVRLLLPLSAPDTSPFRDQI